MGLHAAATVRGLIPYSSVAFGSAPCARNHEQSVAASKTDLVHNVEYMSYLLQNRKLESNKNQVDQL